MERGYFDEYQFKRRVEKALGHVKTILDNNRNPNYPSDVAHEYEDKYHLSTFLTTSTISSLLTCLESVGITSKPFSQLKEWSEKRSVTLRLKAHEECKFIKEATREVQSDTKNVTKAGILGKFESYTVTKVTEYFWEYTINWELLAFVGVEVDTGIVIQSRKGTVELKTSTDSTPNPKSVVRPPIDVNITWLLQNVDENRTPTFSIDRKSELTRTPRRNEEVQNALTFLKALHSWVNQVYSYFTNTVFPSQLHHGLDLAAINVDGLFVPVLPLFEPSSQSSLIPPVFMNSFQAEQARSLDQEKKRLSKTFPADNKLITVVEAHLLLTILHINQINEAYSESVDYIEDLLRQQLVRAIGKEVNQNDFSNYLNFHNRKIYNNKYQPQLFSYAIRRPDHYPEGIVSIEAQMDDGSISNPISTIVAHSVATRPMKFSLNAAANVSFYGDRYLHGYVAHQFAHYSGTELSLCARARQFSSFILLVGRIVSADVFEPKHAIVIQNKDELRIPLLLETIPTPKEFKDAIESLSPEQQRFCKAFRSMQLESTLFGVCVIQIKPQLEKLLNLPVDSLTKEIKLSQDLLTLFIKYQIPSDLVSYDGAANSGVDAKIQKVKEYASRMQDMIDNAKRAELEEARRQQEMRLAEERRREEERRKLEEERRKREEERQQDERIAEVMRQMNEVKEVMHMNIDMQLNRYESIDTLSSNVKLQKGGGGIFSKVGRAVSNTIQAATSRSPSVTTTTTTSTTSAARNTTMPTVSAASAASAPIMTLNYSAPAPLAPQAQPLPPPPPQQSQQAQEQQQQQPHPEQEQQQQQQQELTQEQQQNQKKEEQELANQNEVGGEIVDYTKIPAEMERKFDVLDENHALRPTIINIGPTWHKTFQKSLLSEPESKSVHANEQEKERNQAFDLLDALTKSGALSVDHASLHVVIASTHCFDKSIMETIIQDNMNPIEKIENSSLIVASTIHQTAAANLVKQEHIERLSMTSPLLLPL